MSSKKFFFVMVGTLCLLFILILGGLVGGNMVLQKQSKRLIDLKAQNKVIEAQQVSLIQAKKDIEKYEELNKIAKSIVPQDKDQAKTVREITQFAESSNIGLKAITFQLSNLGQAAAKPAGDDSAKAAAEPGTAAAPVVPPLSQVKPVDGIQGVYALEITVSTLDERPVQYRDLLEFLEKLEGNRRTAHVDKITITPTADGSALRFLLTLNAYVKP